MITRRLQASIDQMLATSPQRLALMLLGFASVFGTSLLVASGPRPTGAWLISIIGFAAAVVMLDPDEHVATTVIGLVVLQWLASEEAPTSGVVVPVAVGLLLFHSIVALLAVTPHTATVPARLLGWWAVRVGIVSTMTAGVWLLVVGLEGRDIGGARPLTIAAVAVLAVAVVVVQRHSEVDPSDLTEP